MIVRTYLAVVVDDPEVAAAVVVVPTADLAAAVVPLVVDDEAIIVAIPDAFPAHGPTAGSRFVGESSACRHGRVLDPAPSQIVPA
jgi:hypothetical protein